MSVTVQLTYDMSKAVGERCFEVATAPTVADAVREVRERFGEAGGEFEKLTRTAAVAVNGVLVNHGRGMKTRLSDGDVIAFVKSAAGG